MQASGKTFDELFELLPSTPQYKALRNTLVRNHITDVDRLRTLSREQLAAMGFGDKAVLRLADEVRWMTPSGVFEGMDIDRSFYDTVRTTKHQHGYTKSREIYGATGVPLGLVGFHHRRSPAALVNLVLAYAPGTTLHCFNGMDRGDVGILLDMIVSSTRGYDGAGMLYHYKYVHEFLLMLEEWGVRFAHRAPVTFIRTGAA